MRLLALNIDKKFIDEIEEKNLYICDVAEDLFDAVYHAEVRLYNLILVYENDLIACKEIIQKRLDKKSAVVILAKNQSKDFEISLLQSGAISVIKEPFDYELILAKLESIHRENFAKKLKFKNYLKLNNIEKQVLDINNNKLNIKGKSYEVLSYLIKNRHKAIISKEELVNAIWDEPELICHNVIEVNINQIRTELKKNFNTDLITTIRNRGYKISNV